MPAAPALESPLEGLVVASYGRRCRVEVFDGGAFDCVTRGKRGDIACGDRVRISRSGAGQAVIEELCPRGSLLYRSDAYREKLIAANVTQIVVVVAAVPPPHEGLLNRCLVAAERAGVAACICLNKSDLPQHQEQSALLELYLGLGYPVIALCARHDVAPLRPMLHGKLTVLVGQSGVGKSTIVNALLPDAAARTGELSQALGGGRHTTTHARLYHLDAESSIIDSPGMQAFGLHHIDLDALARAFVEFRPHLNQCRFRDCRHLGEPACAIQTAAVEGTISARRLAAYRALARERDVRRTVSDRANRRR